MCICWYVNLLEGWNTWSRGWYCDPRAIYFSIWTIQANEAIHPVTGTGSCFIVHWDCRNEWDKTRWWWWKRADTECKSRTTPFLKNMTLIYEIDMLSTMIDVFRGHCIIHLIPTCECKLEQVQWNLHIIYCQGTWKLFVFWCLNGKRKILHSMYSMH